MGVALVKLRATVLLTAMAETTYIRLSGFSECLAGATARARLPVCARAAWRVRASCFPMPVRHGG